MCEESHAVYVRPYQAASVCWRSLNVFVRGADGKNKDILKSVTGYVEPMKLLAIMGPSGSGKSTLLDTLAGRLPRTLDYEGEILLNGHKSKLAYGVSAYVTQDEMLVGSLTVQETLLYAALLKLPKRMSFKEKAARVDEVLVELGLVDAQHTPIGTWHTKGVSGGQKRRVTIGCELVTKPGVMFLDEPTSGLDSAAAYFVMSTIQTLAENNRTILSVIHQPSSEVFELFSDLCLLGDGQVVYFGPASRALSMFEEAGLACPPFRSATDHFLHCINRDFQDANGKQEDSVDARIERLTNIYQSKLLPAVEEKVSLLSQEGQEFRGHKSDVLWPVQTAILAKRMFINNLRNMGVFWLRLGMYTMLCLCIGTIYFNLGPSWNDVNSRAAMLFFIVAFLTFMAISGFPAFQEDMQVFVRERLNGYYGVANFVVANTVASVPFILLISLLSSVVVYWLAGLNDSGDRFVYFVINLFMSLFCVESLMMTIAAVVPHYLMGIAAGGGIMGMYMLVCGFFKPVADLPDPVWRYPLHYISFHSYGFAGFMHNEFDDTHGWACPCSINPGVGCGVGVKCSISGQQVLDSWSINGRDKWLDVLIVACMSIGYRMLFWAALKFVELKNR